MLACLHVTQVRSSNESGVPVILVRENETVILFYCLSHVFVVKDVNHDVRHQTSIKGHWCTTDVLYTKT